MSQAILISDNEVINSLYEVNLRAYVGTNVTIKKSVREAADLIDLSPNIDAIICFKELNDNDKAIDKLNNFLQEKELKIPILILGQPSQAIPKSIVIKNKYDIKDLLQAMAKILEITAKDMAQKEVPQYFPIPLKMFSRLSSSHCDIFYRNEVDEFQYEYFKIIESGTEVKGTLEKYIDEGVEHLFVEAGERLRFINKASAVVVEELERDNLTDIERNEINQQVMGVVAEDILENDSISEEMANISKACMNSINKMIKQQPKLKNLLKMLIENPGDYCYKHAVLATYVAREIIKHISWGSDEQASKVTFAFFFHDIYLVPIYRKYPGSVTEEDLLFRDDVDEEDKQTILDHAKLAGQLVKTFPRCPIGADMIITQHHGMTSGQGFAVNYKDDISPLSKIMIIAEEVSTNILIEHEKSDGQKINVNREAMTNHLKERFRNHTYKKVIDAFEQSKF